MEFVGSFDRHILVKVACQYKHFNNYWSEMLIYPKMLNIKIREEIDSRKMIEYQLVKQTCWYKKVSSKRITLKNKTINQKLCNYALRVHKKALEDCANRTEITRLFVAVGDAQERMGKNQ